MPGAIRSTGESRKTVPGLAWPALAADPAWRQRPRRARRRRGLRPGLVASLVLHAGFLTLAVLAALTRPRPPEPLPPPAYAVYYQSGAPERPAEPDMPAPVPTPEAMPPPAIPPDLPPPPPQVAPPPVPPPAGPRLAEPAPPPPRTEAPPLPPLSRPPDARLAEAIPPPPPRAETLPLPPPAPRAEQPRQEATAITPPRPARPSPPAQRLPGLWLPDAARLAPMPAPRAEAPARRGLDLSLGSLAVTGRAGPEPQVSIRGAEVGPDWRNAFRRWLDENVRYPANAIVVGDEGTNRIQLMVGPDGRVRSWKLVRRSGSVWLDAGLEMPFHNAVLPPFPPGADPNGVEINLTVHWHIIRQ